MADCNRFRSGRGTATLCLLSCLGLAVSPAAAAAGERFELEDGREAALLTVGGLTAGAALWVNTRLEPLDTRELEALDPEGVPAYDRWAIHEWSEGAAKASDVLLYSTAAAPLLLLGETGDAMSGGELGLMYAETLLLQNGLTGLIKGLVRRPRPFTYNPDPEVSPQVRRSHTAVRSFPSGHTSTTFAAGVFLGEVYARLHPDDDSRHWVRAGGLAAATATAWLRVRAGRHFPSDVVAGAALGALVGWAVPRLHEADPGATEAPTTVPLLVVGFRF